MTWDLLDAMKENYATAEAFRPCQAETLRDLAWLARGWRETGEGEEALRASLETFQPVLAATVEECRAHLVASEGMDPDLVALGYRATAAWEAVHEAAGRGLPGVPALESRLADLDGALAALEEWRVQGLPLCPACGHRSEDEAWCACGAAMVIPAEGETEGEIVELGPSWTALYQAAEDAASGAVDGLLGAMQVVEFELVAAEALASGLDDEELGEALAQARDGLHEMASFLETREVAALNRGWARMADAAGALRHALAALLAHVEEEELPRAA